ncbi:GAF domain-containing protein [Sphingomonas jinjuensis]|uniref:GAF domain-containing protein n=1 Tax=Sphingomonas jinjuensis TaxID=535907 RepID=A0A840F810_9SPHN|nr:GAF domain-containing protein [Sphingomonas jinjuensis]MBB4154100.1 GAF domain-containing protein [Sphingomonas jinjuensis]
MDESNRLATLHRYDILDTANEVEFDDLACRIAELFAVPSVLISFIDGERQWYKARIGAAASEVRRSESFCTRVIDADEVVVVPDARLDERFRGNPAVRGSDGIRFYAAAPIKALNRARIGTVCIYDKVPRPPLTEREKRQLASFAAQVIELLEKRLALKRVAA